MMWFYFKCKAYLYLIDYELLRYIFGNGFFGRKTWSGNSPVTLKRGMKFEGKDAKREVIISGSTILVEEKIGEVGVRTRTEVRYLLCSVKPFVRTNRSPLLRPL